ncbi:hypothetical protein PVAP13_5KG489400 [Panicum virgatum]|uniref:Uncharacterized protein n=1 Tax=Panicum virgatum TaxID=38727 RepID=A0A8T0SL20_PANVG|nr:hypothetical protein PVAP13_5KG489400 [Panicum virgatum]
MPCCKILGATRGQRSKQVTSCRSIDRSHLTTTPVLLPDRRRIIRRNSSARQRCGGEELGSRITASSAYLPPLINLLLLVTETLKIDLLAAQVR